MAESSSFAPASPGADRGAPMTDTVVTPAPWQLTGRGLVVLLRSKERVAGRGALGRFASVGFVDYDRSDVGPYRELLFVPHVVRRGGWVGPTVRDIWVTLQASAVSGNANWGLTKSVASIERRTEGGVERWTASDGDGPLGSVAHRPFGPPVPIGKPAGIGRLLQRRDGQDFATPVGVRGLLRATRVQQASFDATRVVDLDRYAVLGAVAITHGGMSFGVPSITDG